MPDNEHIKMLQDFSDEEKNAILSRFAEGANSREIAKEFGTIWQTVSAICNTEKKKSQEASSPSIPKRKRRAAKNPKKPGADSKFTEKEKYNIVARAEEIGYKEAANEAGINWHMIVGWSKRMKAKVPSKSAAKPAAKLSAHTENTKSRSPLEIENAVLKEQVAELTRQIERLKAAMFELF